MRVHTRNVHTKLRHEHAIANLGLAKGLLNRFRNVVHVNMQVGREQRKKESKKEKQTRARDIDTELE